MFNSGNQHQKATSGRKSCLAFTLTEVLISIVILSVVISGVCYGYAQANRIAVFASMSQAAQSYALQGMDQARAAKWNPWDPSTNTGAGSQDELPASSFAVFTQQDLLDIPIKGNPYATNAGGAFTNYAYFATNYVFVSMLQSNPPLRQIRSDCHWRFPLSGRLFTNTVITLRGPDQ
jgi:prepilin-type N-terminal cleavage/methylation domain-containing protein